MNDYGLYPRTKRTEGWVVWLAAAGGMVFGALAALLGAWALAVIFLSFPGMAP